MAIFDFEPLPAWPPQLLIGYDILKKFPPNVSYKVTRLIRNTPLGVPKNCSHFLEWFKI
jgi:hypothetical protein